MTGYYEYLFHYNDHTGLWAAFRSSEQKEYMEKMYPHPKTKALFSRDMTILLATIAMGKFPERYDSKDIRYKLDH